MFEINHEPQIERENTKSISIVSRIPFDFIEGTGFRGGSQFGLHRRIVFFNLLSNTIDILLTFSIFCLSLAALGAAQVLDQGFQLSQTAFIGLFFLVFKASQILTRVFFSASLGDWTCGLRVMVLASKTIAPWQKSFRILTRSLLHLFSGIIFLPLLSFLMNRDIAGQISKAYLFKFSRSISK